MPQQPTKGDKQTLIEQGTEFKGTMKSTCPVVVNGRVEGDLSAPELDVTSTGTVRGNIKADRLSSRGNLSGNIDAGDLFLSGAVGSKTVIKAKNLEVKLSPEQGRMELTIGECTLDIGDEPLERSHVPDVSFGVDAEQEFAGAADIAIRYRGRQIGHAGRFGIAQRSQPAQFGEGLDKPIAQLSLPGGSGSQSSAADFDLTGERLVFVLQGQGMNPRQFRLQRHCIRLRLQSGRQAVEWKLVDEVVPKRRWEERVAERAAEAAARSSRPSGAQGIALPPLQREESADGLASVEEEETRQAVERSLSRLPADQREVLVLRLLGERTYKEIAEITGKKVGTIGWLISVGLKTLGRELAPLLGAADVAHSPHAPGAPGAVRAARLQGELS